MAGATDSLIEQFQKRYNRAQTVADLWAPLHQACYFYAIPNRNRFWKPQPLQGDSRGDRVYDTTAIESTKTFVSRIHTAMTPPQTQWAFYQLDEVWKTQNAADIEEAQLLLNEYMKSIFRYIHASNFDVAINECYFDLAVGTACLIVNDYKDEQPLLFTSIPLDKLAVEEASNGRIESWYRTWENMKISEIQLRWPKAVLDRDLISNMKADPNATAATIKEGVMFMPSESKPYCYVVAYNESRLYTEYFESNPGIVWRFQKTNNDVFGRGPLMSALPSVISACEIAYLELAAVNLNTFRPYMAFSDTVFNPYTFTMKPMSIIPIAPLGADGQPPLLPLPDVSNPAFTQLTLNDLRNQIQRLLFSETPLPENSGSVQPVSATQLMIVQQQIAERIGPLFSRLQQEFLEPLINRCAYILEKRGKITRPKIKNKDIIFKYQSPLSLAKGQEEVSRVINYMQILQGFLGPEIAQVYLNPTEYPYWLAQKMQIPLSLLNDPASVQQVAQQQQNKLSEQEQFLGSQPPR